MAKRFFDNGDGTVTDTEAGFMWKQTDGFQDESIFHSWMKAYDYIRELNNVKFAGYLDWRMPTLEEAESIYDENTSIRDCDRFDIFIDPAFSPGGQWRHYLLLQVRSCQYQQPRRSIQRFNPGGSDGGKVNSEFKRVSIKQENYHRRI